MISHPVFIFFGLLSFFTFAVFQLVRTSEIFPLSQLLVLLLVSSGLCIILVARWRRKRRPRGGTTINFRNLLGANKKKAATELVLDGGIYFGGLLLPDSAATSHFMVVGTTGSGKTLTLKMMLKSVFDKFYERRDQRMIIFDVKQDIVSLLLQGDAERWRKDLIITNPFDARCRAWNVAQDISGPDTALQLATILIPSPQSATNRYFSDAARDLLTAVIKVFIRRAIEEEGKAAWTLRDLIIAMRSPVTLRHVLSQTAEGRDLIALHMEGGETTLSVLSTARTHLAPFEVVAALWDASTGASFSLREFLANEHQILVMGNNQDAQAPIEAINQVMFERLTQLILNQSENDDRRTWFFLDEARKLGRLNGLKDLMTNGRTKGAAVVLGFQDIDGLREVYGREGVGEITSMCGSLGILKLGGGAETTPQWASTIFGTREDVLTSKNTSTTLNGNQYSTSHSTNENWAERKLILPAEFTDIPKPEPGRPLIGWFRSAFIPAHAYRDKPYKAEIPSQEVGTRTLKKTAWTKEQIAKWGEEYIERWAANFVPAQEKHKYLEDWGPVDFERLFLPALPLKTTGVVPANSDDTKNPREQQTVNDKPKLRTS